MRKDTSNVNISSKKGITLVELIVSMTLLMLFSVVCISLINPIERIYQHTVKLSHAQLIADTVVDSIRKECDDVDNSDESSVWIANGSKDGNVSNLFNGPVSGVYVDPDDKGSVLVMRKNGNYCEAIFSCFEITKDNLEAVNDTGMTGTTYGHAATSLLDDSNKQNRQSGYVHFGYYQLKENDKGVTPYKAYDYTNPLTVSTYEGYTVSLSFEGLEFKTDENGVKHPTFVKLTVNVYEGDYSNPSNKRIYSRNTIVSFSPNGSGKGTHGGGGNTPSTLKDIAVRVKWVDEAGNTTSWPDAATVPGVTITFNGSEPHRTYTLANGLNSFVFANVKVTGDKTLTCSDLSPEYSYTYIGNPNSGYVVTYRHENVKTVKLICGEKFVTKFDRNTVKGIVFGKNSVWLPKLDELKADGATVSSPVKVAIPYDAAYNAEASKEDYLLYKVTHKGELTVYVLSDNGKFVLNNSCKKMFLNCRNLESITGFTTNDAVSSTFSNELTTDMQSMFEGCDKIVAFRVQGLVSSKVTNTSGMFKNCAGATSCYMDNWNTSGVTTMENMFLNFGCNTDSDIKIDIHHFSFINCTTLKQMFASSNDTKYNPSDNDFNPTLKSRIKEINFPVLNSSSTSNVTTIDGMFYYCSRLTTADNFFVNANSIETAGSLTAPHVYFNAVTSTTNVFYNCLALKNVRLWIDMPSCTTVKQLFAHCDYLESADLSKSNFRGLTSFTNFFWYCNNMNTVKMNEINLQSFTGSSTSMFEQCYGLRRLEMQDSDLRSVTNSIFITRDSLYHLDLSRANLSGKQSCEDMFKMISNEAGREKQLKTVYMVDTNLSNSDSYKHMFRNCHYLTKVVFSPKASSVTSIDCTGMFTNCYALTEFDHSEWDKSKVSNMSYFFENCTGLKNFYFNGMTVDNCTTVSYMFLGCTGLEKVFMSGFIAPKLTDCKGMFEACSNLDIGVANLLGWDASKVTSIHSMFKDCTKLGGDLGVVSFSEMNFESCTTMQNAFKGCTSMKTLKLNKVNFSSCSDFTDYVSGCTALTKIEISDSKLNAATSLNFLKVVNDIDVSGTEFKGMTSLKESFQGGSVVKINLSGADFSNVTDCTNMFKNCFKLETINAAGMKIGECKNMYGMFEECNNVTSIDLSDWDTSKVTSMERMFYDFAADHKDHHRTSKLYITVDISGFSFASLETCRFMFNTDASGGYNDFIQKIVMPSDPEKAKALNLTNSERMFRKRAHLEEIDNLGLFATTNSLTNTMSMFSECNMLEVIDISSMNLSGVTNTKWMLNFAANQTPDRLTTITVSSDPAFAFVPSKVTDSTDMFKGRTKLEGQSHTKCNGTNNITITYARIDDPDNGKPGYFTAK